MMSRGRTRSAVTWAIGGFAGAAILVCLTALVGCGGDGQTGRENVAVRTPKKSGPQTTVPLPRPADTTMATESIAKEKPALSIPEPPKEVTFEEAETAFHEKRYDQAVELFTVYTERKISNPWGHYMLGLSAWKAGDYERAETAFERSLELDPVHVKSWLNLGRLLLDAGRPGDAAGKIDRALAIEPKSNVAIRLRGRTFHALGENDEAAAQYRLAIRIDHDDAWSMNNLGLILIEEERFDEALPPLARAVELEGANPIFFNNVGMALERTGHFRAAEEAYRSAVAVDASYEKAVMNLGRIETVLEDPGVAPVDLRVLAQQFIDEIERWSDAVLATEKPKSVAPKTASKGVSAPDSTEKGREP